MPTEDELIGFVLDNFQDIGTGQAASTDSVEKVRLYIASTIADLRIRDVVYIADGDSVPEEATQWVAAIISQTPGLRRHFGETKDLPTVEYSEMRLRQQKPTQTFKTLRLDYF